jgi:calpain-7
MAHPDLISLDQGSKAAELKIPDAAALEKLVVELKEPESSRQLPRSEQILVLQASKFNGQIFPPWSRAPGPQDFWLRPSEEKFRYQESIGSPQSHSDDALYRESTNMGLSKHQKDNLEGWMRSRDALPPPSWFPNRVGLNPTMLASQPIDLVQDAASDCSVVASLCAERARVEKGFGSVIGSRVCVEVCC